MANNIVKPPLATWLHPLAIIAAALCVIVAITLANEPPSHSVPITQQPKQTQQNSAGAQAINNPSSSTDANNYVWQGSASDPKTITIPARSISGYVEPVGMTANNEMAVPRDVHVAGWYANSVVPGAIGLSIIDGHVNGRTISQGIFYNLKNSQIGDAIQISFGDGSSKNFTVYSTQTVSLEQANSLLFAYDTPDAAQLNLITCTGTYNSSTHTYDKRVIVSARLN